MLDHGAGRDIIEALTTQAEALDHAAQRGDQHFLVPDLRVGAVAACKRDARAADDRDATRTCSYQHSCLPQ